MSFNITNSAKDARIASRVVAQLTTTEKNSLLSQIAAAIEANGELIIAENKKDIDAGRAKG